MKAFNVKDYIQTYEDEVRCQFWWDSFKIVVPPVFEEESQMTQDEYEVGSLEDAEKFAIIRMARDGIQSYLSNGGLFNPEEMNHDKVRQLIMLCRDALDVVAAHEREACAKVCDERAESYKYATDPWAHEHISEANTCAAAIRERSANARARGE